jgi:Cell wall-associated hydrolases (invasion-associated proteins)
MVTQLLFGETYQVLESIDKWCRIKCDFDQYEGWIDAKLQESMLDSEVDRWRNAQKWIVPGPFAKIVCEPSKESLFISGGSAICFNGQDMGSFVIGKREFYLASNYSASKKVASFEEAARSFLQAPYLWGGRSFYGMDCSGLSQMVYKIMGHALPRDASQQVELGEDVPFVEEAVAGDLAFSIMPKDKLPTWAFVWDGAKLFMPRDACVWTSSTIKASL